MRKLVGEYLRDMTSITSSQIVNMLRNQVVLKDEGERKLLGELLLEADYVTREELEEALNQQRQARSTPSESPAVDQYYEAHTI